MTEIYFITGTDTGIGKTIATGLLAKKIALSGKKVITFKSVQTGCTDQSEDIITHRKLMNIPLQDEDLKKITCPYNFALPASPHLAAESENKEVEEKIIEDSLDILKQKYDVILIEGAGGLMVPLNRKIQIIDFISKHNFPVILVSTSRLGSINHTLLSLEALKSRKISLKYFIYNRYFETNPLITKDTEELFRKKIKTEFKEADFLLMNNEELLS